MEFDLTSEQRLLCESIREWVSREISRDVVREYDESKDFPIHLFRQTAEYGWTALCVPAEYEGLGGSILDQILVIEELSRGFLALGLAFGNIVFSGGKTIEWHGNEQQKRRFLPQLARGEIIFSFAGTEPGGGTDMLAMKTRAVRDGDDFVLTGEKLFSTLSNIADYAITVVRTNFDLPKRSLGLSLFLVDPKTPGITVRPVDTIVIKADRTTRVIFDGARVPKENLIGELDRGFQHILGSLNFERIMVAATAIGNGQAAFEYALNYAKQRHAFGRPIGGFQAIQHFLADSLVELEQARLLTYRAAWMQGVGRECGVEATAAKLAGSEAGYRAAERGMRIMGGHGYTVEHDMQRFFRDSRVFLTGPISNEMAKNFIAQRLNLPRSY